MSNKEKFFETTSAILETVAGNLISAKREFCSALREKKKQKLREMHFVTEDELNVVRNISQAALDKIDALEKKLKNKK